VDAAVQAGWWSWRRGAVIAGVALLVAFVATALGLFFWVRSYAPLYSFGGSAFPTPSRGVRPISLGIEEDNAAYIVRPGPVTLSVDVSNAGRWPVKIEGVELSGAPDGMSVERVAVRRNGSSLGRQTLPRSGWSVPLGGRKYWGQEFTVTVDARCDGLPRGTYSAPVREMRFRYRYLRYFTRTQDVPLVAPMVLAC
jgi:hypothetical protein